MFFARHNPSANGGSPASSRRRSACAESSIGASTMAPRSSDAELRAVELLASRQNAQAILERRDVGRRRFRRTSLHQPMERPTRANAVSRSTSRYTACTPAAPTTLFVGHADPRVDASVLSCAAHRIGRCAERAALPLDLNTELHRRRERRRDAGGAEQRGAQRVVRPLVLRFVEPLGLALHPRCVATILHAALAFDSVFVLGAERAAIAAHETAPIASNVRRMIGILTSPPASR